MNRAHLMLQPRDLSMTKTLSIVENINRGADMIGIIRDGRITDCKRQFLLR